MNLNLIIFVIVLYIIGSTLFRKLTFYLFDIFYRVLIIIATYWFIKSYVNISETQWLILLFLFVFGYFFTLIQSPVKSPYYHFIGVILAPLAEEFLFRGWLLHTLGGSINERIIITSVIFGLYHIKNISYLKFSAVIYQIGYATVIGFPLAWLALTTHSLFLPIVLHSVNNIMAGSYSMKFYPKLFNRKND